MFLVDTNVFLEIILGQDKKEDCKKFLRENISDLHLTDFSLHSIGVILFKYKKEEIFQKFLEDVIPNVSILSLPIKLFSNLINTKRKLNLDFDDAYQYAVAKYYNLKIVTMDRDFEKIKDLEIVFL